MKRFANSAFIVALTLAASVAQAATPKYGQGAYYEDLAGAGYHPVQLAHRISLDNNCPVGSISEWKGVAVRTDNGNQRQTIIVCQENGSHNVIKAVVDAHSRPFVAK